MRTLNILLLVVMLAAMSFAQSGGGRVPTKPSEPKTPPAKTPAPSKRPATLDRIDGKWWTTGNDFGPSEIVFVQNGSDVSGTIRWADGRTGSLTGKLVGKRLQHSWTDNTGNGGSGWLELSWANFLGGPWHNSRVKDGSWTMNRIEGQWCLGGDNKRPRRVTHDAQGRLQITTEDGTRMGGQMDGSYLILDDGEESMKGDMFYKGNRITFPNGAYWSWCGKL
ncbi:MAG TPA: hypothetical protein VI306_15350 [Pyrinomonadaceae bacterium]